MWGVLPPLTGFRDAPGTEKRKKDEGGRRKEGKEGGRERGREQTKHSFEILRIGRQINVDVNLDPTSLIVFFRPISSDEKRRKKTKKDEIRRNKTK